MFTTEHISSSSDETETGATFLNFPSTVPYSSEYSLYQASVNTVVTQMFATQGIKKHREKAMATILKELKQLNDGIIPNKTIIEPISFSNLMQKDKDEALEAVNLIKEKRSGKLKG